MEVGATEHFACDLHFNISIDPDERKLGADISLYKLEEENATEAVLYEVLFIHQSTPSFNTLVGEKFIRATSKGWQVFHIDKISSLLQQGYNDVLMKLIVFKIDESEKVLTCPEISPLFVLNDENLRLQLQNKVSGQTHQTTTEQPTQGATEGEQPTQGATEGEQPTQGATEGEQPTHGATEGEKPTQGATEGEQPTQGATEGGKPTQGATENEEPTQGATEGEQPTQGATEGEQPTQGATEGEQPTQGATEGEKPTQGTTEGEQPTQGTTEGEQPTQGNVSQEQPTQGNETQNATTEEPSTTPIFDRQNYIPVFTVFIGPTVPGWPFLSQGKRSTDAVKVDHSRKMDSLNRTCEIQDYRVELDSATVIEPKLVNIKKCSGQCITDAEKKDLPPSSRPTQCSPTSYSNLDVLLQEGDALTIHTVADAIINKCSCA